MNTNEKIDMILENQKSLMKEVGFIEELLKALLVNDTLSSAERFVNTGDSFLDETLDSLNDVIDDLNNTVNDLKKEGSNLIKQRRPYQHEAVERAKNMGAFRVGAAFRLPIGFCDHANGKVWRITKIVGDYVEVKRTGNYYYEEFNIADILDYYEIV